MNKPRRTLSDIIAGGDKTLQAHWTSTPAAHDDRPLPPALYPCRIVSGEPFIARTNATPGFKLTFEVIEGAHAGRRVWLDLWLTPAALPRTKRDLAKLGITELEQLNRALPEGIRCAVHVVVRTNDGGVERNEVRRFDFVGIDVPAPNPFAPGAPTEPPRAPGGGV